MVFKSTVFRFAPLIIGVFAIAVVVGFVMLDTANAAVGPGAGNSGGGSSGPCNGPGINGCPWTSNGHGWFQIPIDSSDSPSGNSYWDDANAQCKAEGASHVIAYVVFTGEQDMPHARVYMFPWAWATNSHYIGTLSIDDANNKFNSLPAASKGGYVFGSNVGWFCYQDAKPWSVSGSTLIQRNSEPITSSNVNVAPDDVITWYHTLHNDGPQDMDKLVGWTVNGWAGAGNPGGSSAGSVGSTFVSQNTAYRVTQDDVGNTFCQNISWQPAAWNNGAQGVSTTLCAGVPFNYTLNPEISNITDGDMVESAVGVIPVVGRVTNSGGTKSVANIQWQLTQIKYAPGVAMANSGGGTSASDPCAYFTGNSGCNPPLQSGTEAAGYAKNASVSYLADGNLGDESVGTHLCYVMSVKPNSSTSTDWRHSRLYCLVVGKQPKVQVTGGDLIVGRGYNAAGTKISANVITSISKKDIVYYGSWSEYGMLPSGTVKGMASGSGYAGGAGSNDLCNLVTPLSLLTFSNATSPTPPSAAPATCNSSNIGQYSLTSVSQYDAVATRFAVTAGASNLTGNINVAGLTSKVVYPGTGSINLSSSADIIPGKWVIINAPTADVRIMSNINYTNATLTSASDIPQLVIIAKNIVIADNVSNVDAWLFAKGTGADGTLNTCDSAVSEPTGLNSDVCATKLTINGPVIANHLYLYRTAGSGVGPASGEAAEVFNLRPDAYMWASTFSGIGAKARTATTAELPPRF
ncbi:MAG: hypothetical protein ACOH18_03825 [Candidatus Saccharimonadaceae bacterium]